MCNVSAFTETYIHDAGNRGRLCIGLLKLTVCFGPYFSRLISFPVIHACFLACSADISSCMLDESTVSQTCGTDEYLKKLSKIDEGPKAHKQKKKYREKGRGQLPLKSK